MRTVEVALGERKYVIKELTTRGNRKWREEFQIPFQEIANLMATAPNTNLDMGNLPELGDILKILIARVAGSIDDMNRLLFSYSPLLEKDKEWIEDNCYDSELIDAFVKVVGLAYPFGQVLKMIQKSGYKETTNKQT